MEVVKEVILEDKLVDLWQEYPFLYDASLADYKDRNKRDKALEEIALALEKDGNISILIYPYFVCESMLVSFFILNSTHFAPILYFLNPYFQLLFICTVISAKYSLNLLDNIVN